MKRTHIRFLSLALVLTFLVSVVTPALAANYRPGAQSGPSGSYAGGEYYENYKRVPITVTISTSGRKSAAVNGYGS